MRICTDCITRYYEGSSSHGRGIYLCDYCNLYRDLYEPRPGAKKKRRMPLKWEDRLRKMFIVASVTEVMLNGDDGDFSGPIGQVIARLQEFEKEAGLAGYTFVYFAEEGDYDSSWYAAYGVRQETDGEMNKRFKRIRRRRETAKKKRLKKEVERRMKEESHAAQNAQ